MTSARAAMPKVAAWIDGLREAFGRELIDAQIRAATVDGLPTFHASEAGRSVGVPPPVGGTEFSAAEMIFTTPEEEQPHGNRNRRR